MLPEIHKISVSGGQLFWACKMVISEPTPRSRWKCAMTITTTTHKTSENISTPMQTHSRSLRKPASWPGKRCAVSSSGKTCHMKAMATGHAV